jgi:predicted RNA-binding protein with EMAP domain
MRTRMDKKLRAIQILERMDRKLTSLKEGHHSAFSVFDATELLELKDKLQQIVGKMRE